MRLVRLTACCFLMLAIAGSAASPAAAGGTDDRMVSAINQTRAHHGLRPLAVSPSLHRSSRRFAGRLMGAGVFAHRSGVSASRRFHNLGEALAMSSGLRPRAFATLRGWLNSPAHRRIVLSRGVTRLGVGVARGRFRGRAAVIWVLQVGRP